MENTPVHKVKCLPKEFDPRSPTIDFDRTPILINDSSYSSISSPNDQDMSFKSVLEASYDSFDISREDPSPVVSSLSLDIETSCNLDSEFDKEILPTAFKSMPEDTQLITTEISNISITASQVEEKCLDSISPATPVSAPAAKRIIFSPSMNSNSPQKKLSPMMKTKKNASFTCHVDCDEAAGDQENAQQAVKVRTPRTPLASLNNQSNSPLNILRSKQWKDFQEEREKLGLAKSENSLPPFKTAPSSVPAKMPLRRRPLV